MTSSTLIALIITFGWIGFITALKIFDFNIYVSIFQIFLSLLAIGLGLILANKENVL